VADAQVRFDTMDYDPAPAGQEQCFGFNCPKHDRRCEGLVIAGKTDLKRDGQGKNGGVPQWDWDHNRTAPSFAPSINCGGCGWHGYIRGGRTVDCANKNEPEIARPRGHRPHHLPEFPKETQD
jgi:hypothetical protein